MKNLLVILTIVGMFSVIGCTKSPESHCGEAMDHVMELMMKDPNMKKLPKDKLDKMKERFAKKKEKGIQKCVKEYNKDAVACVIKADSMKEMADCNAKKKK
jgi:hypothetical protein